ncbi:Protein EARLY FLOWERING [Ancistrocladus abbreviatus]
MLMTQRKEGHDLLRGTKWPFMKNIASLLAGLVVDQHLCCLLRREIFPGWFLQDHQALQHRLFSMQVFELHRLIKVQKAIASSQHQLEDNLILAKHLVEASPMKKLLKLVAQLPMPLSPLKSSNKHLKIITPIENSTEKPLHAFNYDIRKVAYSWSDFAKPSATSMSTDTRLAMWCLHPPPGNQWLVPVISPSEVLVYKPYTGPCPHLTGFTTPVCGGCGLFTITPSSSSSLYDGPTSHQHGMEFLVGIPLFQSYSAPYSRPTVNSSLPPVVQQVRTVAGGCSAKDET